MQSRASLRRRYFFGSEFFNVQFINFLTWLRGFHDKLENLLSFICVSISKKGLDTKKAPPNIGRFPFDEKSGLYFWKFSVTNAVALSGIAGKKRTNLQSIPKISEIFDQEFAFDLTSSPSIS